MLIFLAIGIAVLVFGGVLWHLFSFIRYVRSGEYAIDKRLWEISE